jgi:hypothetical protein
VVVPPPPPEESYLPPLPPAAFEAPPPPFAAPPPAPPEERPSTRAFRVEAGGTFSHIYDVPISGAEVSVAVGAELRHLAVYGNLTFFGGVQETGLTAFHVRGTGEVEGKFGRFRLGAGLSFGELFLTRATSNNDTEAPTFGAVGLASFDVLEWGDRKKRALYLDAKIRADVADGTDAAPLYWGASFGAGVRY